MQRACRGHWGEKRVRTGLWWGTSQSNFQGPCSEWKEMSTSDSQVQLVRDWLKFCLSVWFSFKPGSYYMYWCVSWSSLWRIGCLELREIPLPLPGIRGMQHSAQPPFLSGVSPQDNELMGSVLEVCSRGMLSWGKLFKPEFTYKGSWSLHNAVYHSAG